MTLNDSLNRLTSFIEEGYAYRKNKMKICLDMMDCDI